MASILNWIDNRLVADRFLTPKGMLKLICGLLVFVSLISHDRYDPSPFNLLTSGSEVRNWLGLPGALFSGFVRDLFGLMSYTFPVLLMLLTRLNPSAKAKLVLQETLELLALCSLVALAIPLGYQTQFDIVGSWGHISGQALSDIPGRVPAILILCCFQLVYIKDRRVDLTVLAAIGVSILLVSSLIKLATEQTKRFTQKTARYSSVNIISPLAIIAAKSSEVAWEKIRTGYDRFRDNLDGTSRFRILTATLFGRFRKPPASKTSPFPLRQNQLRQESELLSQVIEEYRKTHYISDSKTFLKLEEEI
jgi:hypothetical protein